MKIFADKITDFVAFLGIWIFPSLFSVFVIAQLLFTKQDILKFSLEIAPQLLTVDIFVFTITIAILTIPNLVRDNQVEYSKRRYLPLMFSFLGVFLSIYLIIFGNLNDIPGPFIIENLFFTILFSLYSFTSMTVLLPHVIGQDNDKKDRE